jgi:putative AbiEi antitoxin of type IV toxin-antitoxin system
MAELPRISPENRGRSGAVRKIAHDQEGIVARAQLERAGFDRRAIDRALRSGRLHLIHKGVYSTQAPEPATEDALLIAASGPTAA